MHLLIGANAISCRWDSRSFTISSECRHALFKHRIFSHKATLVSYNHLRVVDTCEQTHAAGRPRPPVSDRACMLSDNASRPVHHAHEHTVTQIFIATVKTSDVIIAGVAGRCRCSTLWIMCC